MGGEEGRRRSPNITSHTTHAYRFYVKKEGIRCARRRDPIRDLRTSKIGSFGVAVDRVRPVLLPVHRKGTREVLDAADVPLANRSPRFECDAR